MLGTSHFPHFSECNAIPPNHDLSFSSYSTSISSIQSCSKPYLKIKLELPRSFRFRYKSENGMHGGLRPVIELCNCDDPSNIHIKASLYTHEEVPRLHTNCLYGRHCDNGVCWIKLSETFTAEFPSLPILRLKDHEKEPILKERILNEHKRQGKVISEEDLKKEYEVEAKIFDSKIVKFCFQAFYKKDVRYPVCDPIFSNPIIHTDNVKKLNISLLSRCSGETTGNEDMILLCNKMSKDDVKDVEIIFFSEEGDWEEKANFRLQDVHYKEIAIPFQTPAYKEANIGNEKKVFIKLRRSSDGVTSDAREFRYKPSYGLNPEVVAQETRKQKRSEMPEDSLPGSSVNLPGTEEQSGHSNVNDYLARKFPLSFSVLSDNDELQELFCASSLFPDLYDVQSTETTEGLLDNFVSLSINEKSSEMIVDKRYSSEKACEEMLKRVLVKFIKKSEKGAFFGLLPALMSFKDEEENNFLHLLVEENENLPLLLKILECAPLDLINQVNKMHATPLHIAINKGLWEVARVLLFFGADPNIKDKNGNTGAHLAAMHSSVYCLNEILAPLLRDKKRKYLPDVNVLNYDGVSPLHLSIKSNSEQCASLLLQAEANINIPDGKCGKTPLHFAYQMNSKLQTFLLSQPGIDSKAEDFNGNTPIFYLSNMNENSTSVSKSTECNLEFSTKSSHSKEDNCIENKKAESVIFEKDDYKEGHIENNEDLFCKMLDSNGLWKKFGLYVMDEKELNFIKDIDTTPTKTILNELKKQPGERYLEVLNVISFDDELKEYMKFLNN